MTMDKNKVLFLREEYNKVFFLREEYGNGQGTFIYPNGWYCKVNNEFVEIVEVNGLLRGVMLNKGINEIELLFDPTDLKISQIFSLISFLVIGIGMIYGFIFIKSD